MPLDGQKIQKKRKRRKPLPRHIFFLVKRPKKLPVAALSGFDIRYIIYSIL